MNQRVPAVDKQTQRRPRLARVLALAACCLLAGLTLAARAFAAVAPTGADAAGLPFIRYFYPRS